MAVVLTVALIAFAAVRLAAQWSWIAVVPSYNAESLIVLTAFTLVIYRYLDRIRTPAVFVQIYLLTMAIKLLAYGVYVGFMIADDRSGAPANVVFFLVLYVIFTVIEVAFLHRKTAGN